MIRSHSDLIVDATLDASNRYLVTCSLDLSVRVWNMESLAQLYDFREENERPTRVCFQPSREPVAGNKERTIFACGFSSGKIRLFNVTDVKLQTELNAPHLFLSQSSQSLAEITDLVYTRDGKRLVCGDSLQHLSLFNSEREYSLIRVLPTALYGRFALSPDDRHVAAINPSQTVISIYDCFSLNESLRINIHHCESKVTVSSKVSFNFIIYLFSILVFVTALKPCQEA